MNSMMNININVRAAQAQAAMKATQGSVRELNNEVDKANRSQPMGQRHLGSLAKFGNQLQWTGRMIQYNFTLPLVLAGAAATKFALEQEKALKHVAKVYGDSTEAQQQFTAALEEGGKKAEAVQAKYEQLFGEKFTGNAKEAEKAMGNLADSIETREIERLDKAFTAISNHYGVQKTEVLEVAGAWAAAGMSGRALAESVENTMKAMIIGDMESAKATEALIAVQAQYNLSTQELMNTLSTLNSVENATGIGMQGLIDGFSRAAGVARSAGVDVNHLAAMLAALVPATGSATNAGNALKTIYSRLMAPTKEATQVMKAMGLEVTAAAWQSLTATERLELMSKEFNGMGQAAKNAASSVIASRWQINKFDVLMREMVNSTGYYTKALGAAEDQEESLARMTKELNTILESDPRKLTRMWVMIQNAMAEVIQPLIPFIIYLAQEMANLAESFANLNPGVQKLILLGLALLAMVGPVVRYMGALTTLLYVVGKGFFFIGAGIASTFGAIGTAISAVTTVVGTFFGFFGGMMSAGAAAVGALITRVLTFSRATALMAAVMPTVLAAWRATWATMIVVATGGGVGVLKSFAAMLAGMFAMSLKTTRIVGIFSLMWGAIATALTHHLAGMALAVMKFGARIDILFVAAWTRIAYTAGTIWYGMLMAWTVIQGGFYQTVLAIQQVMHKAYMAAGAAWIALQASLSKAFIAMQALMQRGWAAVTAAGYALQRGIATVFWAWLIAGYIATAAKIKAIWLAHNMSLVKISKFAFQSIVRMLSVMATVALGPWGIAIAAIIALLYAFRDQLGQIWQNIVGMFRDGGASVSGIMGSLSGIMQKAFFSLPQSVQGAMLAVVSIVREAALAVYDWFSYINPWAHHSPSLVENVTTGMRAVNQQFSTLSGIKKHTSAAYAEIKRFGQLTAKLGISSDAFQVKEDRKTLKDAGAGQALKSYNKLQGHLKKLRPMLAQIEAAMNKQQSVVDAWTAKIDKLNKKIDTQEKTLNKLQSTLDNYQSKLSEAESALDRYASTPIEGMREMERQIFANQVAQTKMRWEMMKLEDVYGTYDEIKSKIDSINGAQEILKGTQSDLRAAGAGSEILNQYDKEITKLEEQKDVYVDAAQKLADMQHQLELLQREAEKLDLTKAMKFDELEYQIKMAADNMKELPFDEIMAGIAKSNTEIAKYGPKVDAATAAVAAQQAVVDKLNQTKEKWNAHLDAEQEKLDRIKSKYDTVKEAIGSIETALNDVMSAADKVNAALDKTSKGGKGGPGYQSPGLQNFLQAGDAGFPDKGGSGIPNRKNWLGQEGAIEKYTQDLANQTSAAFASINPFKPLLEKAKGFWDTAKGYIADGAKGVGKFISGAFDGISLGGGGAGGFLGNLKGIGSFLTEVLKDALKVVKAGVDLFWPEIKKIGKGIWDGLKSLWEQVGPALASFGELIKPAGQAIKNIWTVLKPLLGLLAGAALLAIKATLSAIGEAIGPLISAIGTVLKGLIKVVRGIVKIIVGLFTLDLGMMLGGVVDIFSGMFTAIWGVIKGAVGLIWNPIKGLVKGIWNFFHWLWDELVGHSIVPDMIDGIISWFHKLVSLGKWVYDKVILPIWNIFKKFLSVALSIFRGMWAGIQLAWQGLKVASVWLWENVLLPLYNVVKGLWTNYISPVFQGWWTGIQLAWEALKVASVWVWNNVLKPIWNVFKALWSDYVKPSLANWWTGVKVTWSVLKTLSIWVWNNILKPVWDKAVALWNKVKEEFNKWRGRIETAWAALKTIATWVWNNVLKPVFDKAKDLWTNTKEELGKWRGRIETAWNALTRIGTWFKENVMDKVFEAVKDGWKKIKTWLEDNSDYLTSPLKGIINPLITGINVLIKGLNKIGDVLPKVDWSIPEITKLAAGGKIPGRSANKGFMTTGARAIVGEGKQNHPEFVIPTDPTYRSRAKSLLAAAAGKLGVQVDTHGVLGDLGKDVRKVAMKNPGQALDAIGGVPMYGLGGVLGDAWDSTGGKLVDKGKSIGKGVWKEIKKLGINGLQLIAKPAFAAANKAADEVPWEYPRGIGKGGISMVKTWFDQLDKDYKDYYEGGKELFSDEPKGPGIENALAWAKTQAGKPYKLGGVGPDSYDCSGFMAALTNVIAGRNPFSRLGSTATFPWSGFKTGHQPGGFTIGSTKSYQGGIGHMSGTLAGVNVESRGGTGVLVGSAARGYNDPNYTTRAHYALKSGGIALKRRGPVNAIVGDGRYDEAVVPLPKDWRSGGFGGGSTEKNYNFYGDLSFPNITDPEDAKAFLENLENLAGE